MADGTSNLPASPPETPGFPSNPSPLVFEGFKGLNTKPTRNDIEDDELFICDGFFPIGKSNLRVLPDVGPALYTATGGKTIISYYFANISTIPIAVVLLSDGSLVQVRTDTAAVTTIAAASTITTPANGIGVSQASGNQFVIIVAPQTNGYFIWDGTVLAKAGTLSLQITITNGGSGYTSDPTVAVSGGTGSGAAFSVTRTNGIITAVKVTNPGSGWLVGETVTLGFSGGGGSAAAATTVIMPFGVSGTVVETFVSRGWVSNGPKISFTAPSSVVDFSTSSGGGTITSQDSFLRVGFFGLKQSNGFLYTFGDSSLNTISGVTTSTASPPVTTFTNQNVDPQIGTPWKDSVQVFSRNIVFANSFGVHVSYGGAVTKVSGPLDGIYNSVTNFAGFVPSSAVASIFGLQVYMLLYPIIDQWTGVKVNKLLIWDGQKWFTSPQGVTLTYIASQEINSILTAWGTNGTSIYPLFQTPSNTFLKVARSKLWKEPGYFDTKTATRIFGLIYYAEQGGLTTIYIDNEFGTSFAFPVNPALQQVTWLNNSDQVVTWLNNSGQLVFFVPNGFGIIRGGVSQNGGLLGMTLTTTDADDTLSSLTLFTQVFQTNL